MLLRLPPFLLGNCFYGLYGIFVDMKGIIFGLFLFTAIFAVSAFAQSTDVKYTIFNASGEPSNINAVIENAQKGDVVFLGEQHDDAVGHALQFEIFKKLVEQNAGKRKVILSLEMFERDVQIVLDEYLSGLITEKQFLASSRPWGNYQTDYRPLVELAKENKLEVVAANAPRRYVNMVSRLGRESLNKLSDQAKTWLAPLPYPDPSDAYSRKFNALMGGSPESLSSANPILYSQALWDATMADSVAKALDKNKGSLIVHLNGGFHTESRLGTFEQLMKYRPKTKGIVVTMRYEDDFKMFKPDMKNIGDFVVLTDASQPRSGK